MASNVPGGYDLSWLQGGEPGTRRKKIAGLMKAANELRQSYFADGTHPGGARDGDGYGADGPGPFEDASIVRSGSEEMILFPSYGRKHIKRQAQPPPANSEISEQEYWRTEWEKHQDDNAIVDVDVRGWIYTPHNGPMSRKQRLTLGVARQIAGLPQATTSSSNPLAQSSSRASSPGFSWKQDEELIALEAEKIERKGEYEQRYARRGAFSETPQQDNDGDSIYNYTKSGSSSRNVSPDRGRHRLSQVSVASSIDGDAAPSGSAYRTSGWTDPAKMSGTELATAHSRLLTRFKPFLANPLISAPVKAFFYNSSTSREHTVYTDASGHFTCRAALNFIPTHVRVLAAEKLSATEEVTITASKGVSLISDIDDTVKHSGVSTNAREIFRNTFIRDLDHLTIDGVREWYNTLHDIGVSMHYVSNSPWQLYPVLTAYFKLAHLPKGSFHLKQYSGMLQGIFEPVAERKKSSLQKIIRDFPDRKFILVGDSGEADLEVYTDVALEHPGKVVGIFIRDVTTPIKTGYFDPSNGPPAGSGHSRSQKSRSRTRGLEMSKRLSRPYDVQDDDAELRAAIAASLSDMEAEAQRDRRSINPDLPSPENMATPRPSLPPRIPSGQSAQLPNHPDMEEDLIDFSEDPPTQSSLAPPNRHGGSMPGSTNGATMRKASPSLPPKPPKLRSPSPRAERPSGPSETPVKSPPPRPRKPSSAVKPASLEQMQTSAPTPPPPPPKRLDTLRAAQHQPSPLSRETMRSPDPKDRPSLPSRPSTQSTLFQGFTGRYNNPPPKGYWESEATAGQPRPASGPRGMSTLSAKSMDNLQSSSVSSSASGAPLPPPPRLRNATTHPMPANNRKASNRHSGAWSDASGGSLPGSPGEPAIGKKEFAWNQRWAKAKSVLERQGVTLRTWRVGSDVADVCVRLVEQTLREMK